MEKSMAYYLGRAERERSLRLIYRKRYLEAVSTGHGSSAARYKDQAHKANSRYRYNMRKAAEKLEALQDNDT